MPVENNANARIETIRRRAIQSAMRCIRALLIQLGRDYERCGKAACARTRRCRGLACEPHAPHGLSR